MKKRIISALLALTMAILLIPAAMASNTKSFPDLSESHWAYGMVAVCAENGLFEGCPDGTFRPDAEMTRGDAITAISRQFKDAKLDSIWNGAEKQSAIRREEAFYLLATVKNYEKTDAAALDKFEDKSEISEKYADAVSAAVSHDLVFGHKNLLRPKATLTRAEFAALLYRAVYGEEILAERRAKAHEYMLKTTTMLWRIKDEVFYTTQSNVTPAEAKENVQFTLYPDRIYHGVPYSYAGGTAEAFLDYAVEQDENGVYVIDGLTWENISGGSGIGRIGNDCSSALLQAWGQLGETFKATTTGYLTEKYGIYPVGDYKSVYDKYEDTGEIVKENGDQAIFRAYSLLRLADGVVKRANNSGHCRMVTEVNTVYLPDGTIDGENSTMTMIEQTIGSFKKDQTYYDEKLGCDVYKVGIEQTFSFAAMAKAKYIPITVRALRDPAPIAAPVIKDTETSFGKDSLLKGTLTCNWMMDNVTMDITSNGEAVQTATAYVSRKGVQYMAFDMQEFVTVNPVLIRGKIAPEELAAGKYNCKVTVRLVTGEKLVVRNFDFEI